MFFLPTSTLLAFSYLIKYISCLRNQTILNNAPAKDKRPALLIHPQKPHQVHPRLPSIFISLLQPLFFSLPSFQRASASPDPITSLPLPPPSPYRRRNSSSTFSRNKRTEEKKITIRTFASSLPRRVCANTHTQRRPPTHG